MGLKYWKGYSLSYSGFPNTLVESGYKSNKSVKSTKSYSMMISSKMRGSWYSSLMNHLSDTTVNLY